MVATEARRGAQIYAGSTMTSADRDRDHSRCEPRFRVLIAGGGVAALEALLALRALAGDRVATIMFAPDPEFRYRPLSVTEPFDLATPRNLDLLELALENDATFMCDGLAEVDPQQRSLTTTSGRKLDYDALLVAIGARGTEAVPGALTFRDSADRESFRTALAELEGGAGRHLVFAVPGGATWPLGLYELALLSNARLQQKRPGEVEITVVTPEQRPMAIFGKRASGAVGELLEQAGIALRLQQRPLRFEGGELAVEGGEPIACDRVVSLPMPEVPPIPGLPQGLGGFIPVDRYGGVLGLESVFAAGDATWFPVKQGGLAAQQADCAASAIAARAGAQVDPQPFRPVLRGALLTEWGPRYLRAPLGETTEGIAARSPLWWPPAKVAGKYLAPFLVGQAGYRPVERPLEDLKPPPGDRGTEIESGHEDVIALALSSAEASSQSRDFSGALRWLEVAEDLELYLPSEYELKRISWQYLADQR